MEVTVRIIGVIPIYEFTVSEKVIVNGFVRHIKAFHCGKFLKFRRYIPLRQSVSVAARFARAELPAKSRIVIVHEIIGIVVMIPYVNVESAFPRSFDGVFIGIGDFSVAGEIAIILRENISRKHRILL